MNILAPSILSADFSKLGEEIVTVAEAGAQYIHIDVMDGDFVPSISFGMPVISSVRKVTDKVFDVHLMVTEPERYIDAFVACGADIITVHVEACRHLDRVLSHIREKGVKAGVSLNPATPLSALNYILDKVDMVLLMTVNPGFGGQSYIESCTGKIQKLRNLIQDKGLAIDIEVDGGINDETLRTVLGAGANVVVAGSSIYKEDAGANVKRMLNIMKEYEA